MFIRVDAADAGSGDDLSGRTETDGDSGMTARASMKSVHLQQRSGKSVKKKSASFEIINDLDDLY